MKRPIPLLHSLPLLLLTVLCTACYYSHSNKPDHWTASGEGAVDSVNFYISHHYWIGYNFQATDSLALLGAPPLTDATDYALLYNDTVRIRQRDKLVVAKVVYVPTD